MRKTRALSHKRRERHKLHQTGQPHISDRHFQPQGPASESKQKSNSITRSELTSANRSEAAAKATPKATEAAFAAGSELTATQLAELPNLATNSNLAGNPAANANLADAAERTDAADLAELTILSELPELADLTDLSDLANLADLSNLTRSGPQIRLIDALDYRDGSRIQIGVLRGDSRRDVTEGRTIPTAAAKIAAPAEEIESAVKADVAQLLENHLGVTRIGNADHAENGQGAPKKPTVETHGTNNLSAASSRA